jgi:hypothetical protein
VTLKRFVQFVQFVVKNLRNLHPSAKSACREAATNREEPQTNRAEMKSNRAKTERLCAIKKILR